MKAISIGLCYAFVSLIFFSCQKDVSDIPDSDISILGNWKFVSMDVSTNSTVESTDALGSLKTITTSNYITENNTGNVTIDASKMSISNVSYSVNTIAEGYIYTDGSLTDSIEAPLQYNAPATSGVYNYRMIGSDSIYFDSGSFFMNGATQQSLPGGAKLKMQGDTLYLIQSSAQTKTLDTLGATIVSNLQAKASIKLLRQ